MYQISTTVLQIAVNLVDFKISIRDWTKLQIAMALCKLNSSYNTIWLYGEYCCRQIPVNG